MMPDILLGAGIGAVLITLATWWRTGFLAEIWKEIRR